jgi:hypothetical protein
MLDANGARAEAESGIVRAALAVSALNAERTGILRSADSALE